MRMEKKISGKVWIQTAIVFVMVFLIFGFVVCMINKNRETEEKLKAAYTAETTVSRVEAQLRQYLAESKLMENLIEAGYEVEGDRFEIISQLMQDENDVIEAHELAKNGTVNQVYPMEGNEGVLGLNLFKNADRKKEAYLAKRTGEYTIAGPFELVQGGKGALLFDPVNLTDENGQRTFWGFSVLVLDWEKFLKEIELERLEDADYNYQIWKRDLYSGEKIVIAENMDTLPERTLEVACKVPNDTWYFEIVPVDGWTPKVQLVSGYLIALLLAILAAAGYWQAIMRRYKDVIHAQEMEESARKAQDANDSKTRFLFNMSHDIRTPMNAIIGFSDLLERHIDEREKAVDYIHKIRESSDFLLSLINSVLEMARIESGKVELKKEVCCVPEVMESLSAVFETSIREKKLEYRCNVKVVHEYVMGDETKLREIFLNVISNAVKYTPEGGRISMDVNEIQTDQKETATFVITLQDTGIGMSADYLPHIFEEFTREHTSTESRVVGTGLGLPIVKSLVELMGGTIQVESAQNKGTKIVIVLSPEIASEAEIVGTQTKISDPKAALLEGKRILLAEDNELNAEIALEVLEESGFLAERAKDGEDCVKMLKEKPAGYYDLILMDIQMPCMDGYEATECIRKLKDERAAIPIVAMTANAFEEDKKKAFEAGMNDYVAKPIDRDRLIETIGQQLG